MSEIESIRQRYEAGALDGLCRDLEVFLKSHRDAIRNFRNEQVEQGFKNMPLDVAVKFYILKHRTINPGGDISEQLQEIQREKWIKGVQIGHEPDAQSVAQEWTRKYSASWRAHRVTSIVFVFEKEKDRYLKLLDPSLEETKEN